MNIAAIILAAGSASRMGTIKQLLPWGNTTLLGNAINIAKGSNVQKVVVVLGANSDKIMERIERKDIELLVNDDWHQGMGSSISKGISYLERDKSIWDGALVMLGDQPLLNTIYLNRMIHKFYGEEVKIVATNYKGRPGVPAIFHRQYFPILLNLSGDNGARAILKDPNHDVETLDGGGLTLDIDSKEDYEALLKHFKPGIDPQ